MIDLLQNVVFIKENNLPILRQIIAFYVFLLWSYSIVLQMQFNHIILRLKSKKEKWNLTQNHQISQHAEEFNQLLYLCSTYH